MEVLKQEKSRLASQLVAQESVMEGLKAERKLWGQELAQQGKILREILACDAQDKTEKNIP